MRQTLLGKNQMKGSDARLIAVKLAMFIFMKPGFSVCCSL
jgi:hypothetical protein